ncbi:cysteinyl-tRNA synthetase [Seinonella peptonophila]|uniref:Cysteine--tRNA ligase n=1 Tax=Seinonella peptonophila TaxID=112248 RepID=A0A1M4YUZ1_9BACL|nr:cysteine--tRNA ligase [Seinonella peptonophila]SHF09312.1 cysteinyl-tRNA synthetase [Seinonella peptonophila]
MQFYNTLGRKKEEFYTVDGNHAKIYVCGPTVYNYIHIGNARVFVFFDVMRRYLRQAGYEVTYVQNFTDVDDRLIEAAKTTSESVEQVAERYIDAYFQDMDHLGVERADVHPRATEHVPEMIEAIQQLLADGYAYEVAGDVYYRTKRKTDYGKLSQQTVADLKIGARVEVNDQKEDPLDFALWKASKPGEISWETPWGMPGRPGWHIECSVMAKKYLGDTLDIHAGGVDLCFPHHENEIAQSEALTGQPFARYWLHNGFIQMGDQKMAKSLGNVKRVVDLRSEYSAPAIRYFLLSVHYRQPITFTKQVMEQAEAAVERLQTAVNNVQHLLKQAEPGDVKPVLTEKLERLSNKVKAAMNDDLNTANAISVLFEAAKLANEEVAQQANQGSLQAIIDWFSLYGETLFGLVELSEAEILDHEIEMLIEKRQQARANRNYQEADQIRDELAAKGILLEDTPQGVRWKRKS